MTLDLDETRIVLRRTPGILDALLRGLPEPWSLANEGPGTWSSLEVVGHLLHSEESNWVPRIRHLLRHGESAAFPPLDPVAFQGRAGSAGMSDALDAFARARARSLGELDALGLSPADLDRRGRHPDFGPITLGQLLGTWAVHDLNHLGQIVQVLARAHGDAVGPWRAYLGILDR